MDEILLNQLNDIFQPLHERSAIVRKLLSSSGYAIASGWYNNHSISIDSRMRTEYYAIPVVSVREICDIGFDVDHIFIESYISKSEIELIDFEMLLTQYCFEIYDAEEFMNDICTSNDSVNEILSAIRRSEVKSFCINIIVKQTVGDNHIMNLVALMKSWVRGNRSRA